MTAPNLFDTSRKSFIFKAIVVGEGGVGKTSLCMRVTRNIFTADYKLTLGTAFFSYETFLEDINTTAAIQIWDLGGQSKFGSILRSFTQNAKGIILTFDISSIDSFQAVQERWKLFLINNLPKCPTLFVSTKNDLPDDQRMVSQRLIDDFIKKEQESDGLNIISYIPTSSKLAMNAHVCFRELAKYIVLHNEDFA